MNSPKKVFAIIPARGGSKGISGKNIIDIAGKPLIAWSIEAALNCDQISEVFVSTDDSEIAEVSRLYGATIIDRPSEISGDKNTSEEALLHFLNSLDKDPDLIVFLQASSPIRASIDIDFALQELDRCKADSLFSSRLIEGFVWKYNVKSSLSLPEPLDYDPKNRPTRQDKTQFVIEENGSIYIFKPEILRKYSSRLGGMIVSYKMPMSRSYQIDNPEDIKICEFYLRKTKKNQMVKKSIKHIIYDFDGTMTDDRVLVSDEGHESALCNRGDGLAVYWFKKAGFNQLILTAETVSIAQNRAIKLGIPSFSGCYDKKGFVLVWSKKHKYNIQDILYVGNGVNDLEAMKIVGFSVAPADAHPKVKAVADYVTKACGGGGVIRELADVLL